MIVSTIELLKVIFLGIVEGITEWLPISSTGHMLLVDQFLTLHMSDAFKSMFFVVIQLGAILAVVVQFWKKMFPFHFRDPLKPTVDVGILRLWLKVIVACFPAGIIGFFLDDYIDQHLHTPTVIAVMLIFYGVLFIVVENHNRHRLAKAETLDDIDLKTAFIIGIFQALSLIPGTSRSGATIVGGLMFGASRVAAAEFTFFLAVPTMLGASALKLVKFGSHFTGPELFILIVGMVVAFVVSIIVIRFLMSFIKQHDFKVFGWYRIVLGIIVLVYFSAFK